MENASKALLMAGGMLITIIIVGVLVMAWNNMRELPKTQEQIKEAEELSAFNKKYESYAKDGIRGSDVLTVTNMAITNNNKYSGQSDMQIKVELKIKNDITGIKIHYKWDNFDKKVKESEREPLTDKLKSEGEAYILTNKDIYNASPFNNILNPTTGIASGEYKYIESKNDETEVEKPNNWNDYWVKSDLGAEFRRKKFDCEITDFHDNGRVAEIYIEEQ